MVPKTSNQGRLFRILRLAAVAVVLVLIGGPGKLAELPPLARWGRFACIVFAFFEPMLPGSCFGGQLVLAPQTLALNRYARTFWKVLLILYICCFVAEMIGVVWFYGKVPLKYSLIAPAVTAVLIGVTWRTLKLLRVPSDSSEVTRQKLLNC
jgi:hypothetical protein